ncbi:MAG TPA: NAD-dependent epimerase/dehydratase family protein [Gemmatimonadales bacterium]|nr:NAD-dependent epimerase/dehydratase family protein [Gemmatimonadales bacterium]
MRTLVTGGTGFVGSHLVEALRQRGDEVTAMVRSPARAAILQPFGVTLATGDLHDTAAMARALAGVEVVYQVAGLTAARNAAEFQRVNVDGTATLLAAAAEAGVRRFVLVSSLAAAGPSPRGGRRAELEPSEPVTLYGRSKAAAEDAVRRGAVPWVIARPPAVYGPRDVELLKVFKIARLGVAPVFGDGSQELSLVYGPDLAEALAAMGSTVGVEGRVYYPAHPEVVTSGALVHTIGRAMGRRMRLVPLPRPLAGGILQVTGLAARLMGRATLLNPDKANEFFQPAWTCDPGPLERETGWRAAHDVVRGVAATRAWYRREGWL